jgi:peptidyl-prolyl cis-trans isomerase B (cyclophilin B)
VKPDTAYTMTLATNCGDIVIETLPAEAPATVASMAFLTEEGYFDLTACHRLTTEGIFVLQCGDPAGNGTGGPGYSIPDENLPAEGEANYPAGTVAMANAGPGTGGSQFFIVYADTTLPSGYTIWGKVTKGLDIVEGIAAAGVEGGGTDGPPAQPVVIEKATLTTSPAN